MKREMDFVRALLVIEGDSRLEGIGIWLFDSARRLWYPR